MKDAMLGTDHHSSTAKADGLLRQAGINYLKRIAGYVPSSMPASHSISITLSDNFTQHTTLLFQELANNHAITSCNSRALYLMLAWILIGEDNPFNAIINMTNPRRVYQVAKLMVAITTGYEPTRHTISTLSNTVNQEYSETQNHQKKVMGQLWALRSGGYSARKAEAYHQTRGIRLSKFIADLLYLVLSDENTPKQQTEIIRKTKAINVTAYSVEKQARVLLPQQAWEWHNLSDNDISRISQQLMVQILHYESHLAKS